MQSGGGGGGGPGRGVGPAGRAGSTSSAASPSSSSSAVSTPQLGFDSVQHQQHQQQQQQQQQQQLGSRQPLHQQQFLRKPEGNEALLAYQAAGMQGVLGGGGSSQMPQQSRKFIDLAQQHGSQDGQSRSQGVDQQALNPVHQAYLQYAFQAAQQKSGLTMQPQQQAKMGLLGPPSGKDQDMRLGNMKMQELMSNPGSSQAQASSSKNLMEHFTRGEKQMDQGQPPVSDRRSDSKPSAQPSGMSQFMPGNMLRPMLAPQSQPSAQTMPNNQIAFAAQLQAFAL